MEIVSYIIFVMLLLLHNTYGAIDNAHFYRATNFFGEPRLEHDHFTSFDTTIGGGSTHKGHNSIGKSVPLFDIYEPSLIQEIGINVPNIDPTNSLDTIIINLAQLPRRKNFATISTNAQFSIIESNLMLTHNIKHGIFLQFHIPVRSLTINKIKLEDLSPDDTIFPNKNTPQWQNFLASFDAILNRYNINKQPFSAHGIGDLTGSIGWTHNYQDTKTLDFIDFSCMAGFLGPTGKQKNEDELFSIPLGYNGHYGFPTSVMVSLGIYDWITLGGYVHAIFFADKNKKTHLKTAIQQHGIIKLAQATVRIQKGSLWTSGFYVKMDHFARGLSCTFSYSCANEQSSSLVPNSSPYFTSPIINTDPIFRSWSMHTLHFFAEYDFAQEGSSFGPRIGLFYNYPFAGKRIFNTSMEGGAVGLDISFDV